MSWRKWIVRGVVYGIIALCGGAALLYQRWTNPAAVREQVIAKLHELFPGAQVSVDSAQLRILGGIQLNGLRLCRRDDPERGEFLQVPSAVVYHDKEKILDGELALRKIELHKPRLRLRRDKDGKWNVMGLTQPVPPSRLLPTLVVHQGTILFDDRLGDAAAPLVEVDDVNITLINDPIAVVSVRGSAGSALLGKLQVQGTVRREPLEWAMAFEAGDVPITTALVRRMAPACHGDVLDGLAIEALAEAHGEVSYRPGPTPSLFYDVHGKLSRGKLRHPKLPLPLEELSASLHLTAGGVRVESLDARSGKVAIHGEGSGTLASLDQDFEAQLQIKHFEVCKELCGHLPQKLRSLHEAFQPRGPTTVAIACARRGGEWVLLSDGTAPRVSLRPEDVSMCFVKFRYPIEHLGGTLDYGLSDRKVRVDLSGMAGKQPVLLKGTWQGEGTGVEARFDITANNVPIDETLLTALPEAQQKLARSFRATGQADIKAHIRRDPGALEYRNEYHVRIHDAAMLWDSFPYPLEQVRGVLDIFPRHWEFHDFHATHKSGQVAANGRSTRLRAADGGTAQGIALEITGRGLAMDGELRKGLTPMPGLLKAWDTFRPQGRLNFVATVNHPTDKSADLDVLVDAQGCAVEPMFFPYLMHDIGGQFHYHQHRLDLDHVKAWHGGTLLSLDRGSVALPEGGGYYVDFPELQARDLRIDDDMLKALPGKLHEAAQSLQLHDRFQAKARLVVAQAAEPGSLPDVYWDCLAGVKKATLHAGLELSEVSGELGCKGRHNGKQLLGLDGNILLEEASVLKQPFHDVQIHFGVNEKAPEVLLVGLRAPLYGGDVAGQVRVDFDSTLRYEVNLTASQIDLKQFGKHNLGAKSEIEGLAVGRLHLTGLGAGIETLDGNGSIDVPNGKLCNLPLLLDLLKFLGLHWPDRTAFEELHALFAIHGSRVHLRKLDLLGNAISLSGKGEANLDGTDLAVDFYPTWRMEQLLPPAIRLVPPALSKSILTIEMRGAITSNTDKDLKFTKRWVPILLDPVLNLQQRIVGEPRMERKD
jgi:hypothetical protein